MMSSRRLTKYEVTKIIGIRAQQIACGSEPQVQSQSVDSLEIARQELKEGKIPMVLYREYPDKSKVAVKLNNNKDAN